MAGSEKPPGGSTGDVAGGATFKRPLGYDRPGSIWQTDPAYWDRWRSASGGLWAENCFTPGMVKNTYGTECFLLMNTGERAVPSTRGLLTTIGWGIEEKVTYCLEGAVSIA